MAAIARHMKAVCADDFSVVFTLPAHAPYTQMVRNAFEEQGVADCYCNIGPIKPDDVASLISCCNAMCTFSVLESFSNNFIEAWRMKVPLVVTDADWARGACNDAALYINPLDPVGAAESMSELAREPSLSQALVSNGEAQLKRHPTAESKLELYFGEMDKALELGPCPKHVRLQICWPRVSG